MYKWEKSAVIRGFPNTENTSKCLARPEKSYGDLYFDTSSYKFENQRVLRYIRPVKKVILCACNWSNRIVGYFGFFYDRGLFHHHLMNIENIFYEKVGHQRYSSIMNHNHLKLIKRMIIFDDSTTRNDRWKKDKLSAFREVFEMFKEQCGRNYWPDDILAMDETLYPTRWSIGLKTYNKNKLAKYGLHFQSLRNARKPYVITPFLTVGNRKLLLMFI